MKMVYQIQIKNFLYRIFFLTSPIMSEKVSRITYYVASQSLSKTKQITSYKKICVRFYIYC